MKAVQAILQHGKVRMDDVQLNILNMEDRVTIGLYFSPSKKNTISSVASLKSKICQAR